MISVNEISRLSRALIDADVAVDKAEDNLREKKETARILREETIPAAMEELGLSSIVLDTGETLTVRQEVYASIPRDREAEAFRWLDEHGYGGLIKIDVTLPFARGESEQALELAKRLESDGYAAAVTQKVHPQTLKAFIKEKLADGANLPLDLFGARPVMSSKVKGAK